MHFILFIAATLLTTTLALPTASPQAAPGSTVTVTLFGATPEDTNTIVVPVDSEVHFTGVASSISHLQTSGGPCGFFGVDGLVLDLPAATYIDVGPPQTIEAVACGTKPWPST